MTDLPSTSYVEVEDLVRIRGTNRLAFVERVAGDSTDDDDSLHHDDDASENSSITDERGRLIRWVDGIPGVSSPSSRRLDLQNHQLISTYDDEPNMHDDEDDIDELPESSPDDFKDSSLNGTVNIPRHLPEGHAVIVNAATGEKTVRPATELTLLDRNFDPGQLVTWAPSCTPQGYENITPQSGIVEKVAKRVIVRRVCDIIPSTVDNPDPETCFEVSSEQLGFFSGVRAGDTVVRGSWVGVVDYFQEDVFVEFSDGGIACVPGHRKSLRNVDSRTPDRKRPDPFSEGLFYPGQRVRSLPEVWRTIALWIRGSYSGEDEGIVKSVKIGDLGVEFVAKSMYTSTGEEPFQNLDEQERGVVVVPFSQVTLLESFRNLWWSVGDRGFLLVSPQECHFNHVKLSAQSNLPTLPTAHIADDGDDAEWEEDDLTSPVSGAASSVTLPPRLSTKTRSKKQGGRLMKAQRKARERSGMNTQAGTVTDAALMNSCASPDDVVQVVGTRSLVDVLWQDGTKSVGVSSLNFRINNHPDPYDFWPGEIVTRTEEELLRERCLDGKGSAPANMPKGAVVRVNQKDRTATVKWQKDPDSPFEEEEETSVYELKSEEYDVSIGDTVLRVPRDSNPDEKQTEWVGVVTNQHMGECTVAWYGGTVSSIPARDLLYISGGDEEETFETGMSTADIEGDPLSGLRGQGIRALVVEVSQNSEYYRNWGPDEEGEGVQTESASHTKYGRTVIEGLLTATEVYRFRRDIEGQNIDAAVERAVQIVSKELEDKRFTSDGSLRRRSISKSEERRIAAGMTFHVLSELFCQTLRTNDDEDSLLIPTAPPPYHEWAEFIAKVQAAYAAVFKTEVDWLTRNSLFYLSSLRRQDDAEVSASNGRKVNLQRSSNESANKISAENESMAYSSPTIVDIERFSIVDEFSNFHVFPNASSSSVSSPNFLSVVRKEWNRLRKNLPSGVIVRVCEAKLDRLRAGIVGPQDTPYADVIFFFDIQLCSTYPMSPPEVWFHSHGRRLNPNLYEDGKVCLSILGTWDGDDIESWDAKTSNLLRVLLSLQALVFVEEPYYNEAGYGKQRGTSEGRLNSLMYNESAFLLSMRHVVQTLRPGRVPKDCREVAVTHYRNVGPRILERCKRLLDGLHRNDQDADGRSVNGKIADYIPYSSPGFKKSLHQLMKSLETAISSCYEESGDNFYLVDQSPPLSR